MVCKKYQVYDWFRTLDGAKRIDFLNGMLHLCFPLELRFLGSCIEELARKDYSYLRDAEIKANAVSEIQLMRDIGDKVTRSKMIVTLALLASGNYECARFLYDLLNVDIMEMLEKMKSCLDEKIADEFLLLLTMAANHPAFDFQMKSKMSQLYLNAEYKLKQNKILLKESESDLNLCNKSEPMQKTDQSQPLNSEKDKEKKIVDICSSSDLLLLKNTLNDIKKNINNTCKQNVASQEINNNLNKKKNRNKVESNDIENLTSNFEGLLGKNSMSSENLKKINDDGECKKNEDEEDELPEEEKLNDSLIESINFEGVQTIKGTENYKFIIKIQWSDKTYNEIDKTYSELCEFNKQLINLYPKELSGLMETSQLVLTENQKEDFIKELPLVTDYCSKIASLPKVVCESDFLRSFFRSNLSNSSITIANDSNSPNRQAVNSNKTTPSKNSSAEKKNKTVNKKLIKETNSDKTDDKTEFASKTEQTLNIDAQEKNHGQSKETEIISPQSTLPSASSASTSDQMKVSQNETDPSPKKSSVNTNVVKSKTNSATVSVANIMNNDVSTNKIPNKNTIRGNERINSGDSSVRQGSVPPLPQPGPHHPQIIPNAQLLNYPYQLNNPNQANLYSAHQMQMLNNQFPPGNVNQPLHLHTFQPINNMIIGSPPCASPTTTATNPHSLNNSRSNSPWMMMPPPLPPLQSNPTAHSTSGQPHQANIPNGGQQFYQQNQHNIHQNVRSNSINKNNSLSNLKDSKQHHYNNQDELLLRYAIDNNNSHYNSNPNLQPVLGIDETNSLNYSTLSLNERYNNNNSNHRMGKVPENNAKKNNSKSKNNQYQNNSESLLTTALTNNNHNSQYNNNPNNQNSTENPSNSNPNPTSVTTNGISSGSSSGAMSPKPVTDSTNNTSNSSNTTSANNNNNNINTSSTNNATNNNIRSSSSCSSSSYHQTPPPQQSSMAPVVVQQIQNQNQQNLPSPSQQANAHAAAIAAYNATLQQIAVAYHQKNDQWPSRIDAQGHHIGSNHQLPPNHHLIPIPNSQLTNYQHHPPPPPANSQTSGPNSMPSLLLAPMMNSGINSPNQNYLPVGFPAGLPVYPHNQTNMTLNNQKNQQNSSKQQFKNVLGSQERSQTPPIQNTSAINTFITSDDENGEFSQINNTANQGNNKSNLTSRVHRKSIPNINNFPNKYTNRQHNSHSISNPLTASASSSSSTIQSSSGTSLKNGNTGSTSTLLSTNATVNSSNNSSSVSPQNQTSSTQMKPANESSAIHSSHSPSQAASLDALKKSEPNQPAMGSPKSQVKRTTRLSPTKEQSISVELNSNDLNHTETTNKEGASNNGQYSSSSTSSSSSFISNNNNQSKSPKTIAAPLQQSAPLQQNGNLYYSPVVSPYPYIEGQSIYTVQNGPPPTQTNSSQQSNSQQTGPHVPQQHLNVPLPPHQYNAYQQQPQVLQLHHQNSQQPHVGSAYYSSLPMQQQQNFQTANGSTSSTNNSSTNCATPTPGSSPNTISTISQQIAPNNNSNLNFTGNYNIHGGQSQPPAVIPSQMISTQQPPPFAQNSNQSIDQQHVLNPYNLHHMMSLVANNQQVNGTQMQSINPNMVMMMMMNPPPGQIPPGQLPPGQMMNNKQQQYNYAQFQTYRSLTPNTLQQQQNSPSMPNNMMMNSQQHNSRKKLSCYNCGSMNHPAAECKEPTLESISQPTQFRLNFKVNNNQFGNSNHATSNSNHTNESDDMPKNDLPVPGNNNPTKKGGSSGKNSISPNTNATLVQSSNVK